MTVDEYKRKIEIYLNEIRTDSHNLKEAHKLEPTRKVKAYIKKTKEAIDKNIRILGRLSQPDGTRKNEDAYKAGLKYIKGITNEI